jgi:hypothetical protein
MSVDLPAQLLSGPDLGGGFLFQLTRDRSPLPLGYTFHLQEAGSDAANPPGGSPQSLGYAHPPATCMYGGPLCWEKHFAVGEEAATPVRLAYNRTRFVIGPLLAQASGTAPAAVGAGLRELLTRIVGALEETGVRWQITGSTAAWARGVPIEPFEINLQVERAGVRQIAELLGDYLVEPNHPTRTADRPPSEQGAAFVGTFREGIRVVWASLATDSEGRGPPAESGPGWIERRQYIEWEEFRLPVSPIEFELLHHAETARSEGLDPLLEYVTRNGFDGDLWDQALRGAPIADEVLRKIERELATPHRKS